MISATNCEALNSTWRSVVTDPTLQVQHGVEVTLTCPATHVNTGGNKATCKCGKLVLNTKFPQCSLLGNFKLENRSLIYF